MSAKYPFYGKKGRPSNIEREICNKIRKGIDNNEFTQADVDAFIDSDGLPMNQSELETLYTTLTGESAISHERSSSAVDDDSTDDYEYEDDHADDGIDGEDEFVDQSQKASTQKNTNALNYDPFAQPVIERDYTKGVDSVTSDDDHSDHQDESRVSFDENDTAQPNLDTESIHGGEDDIPSVNYEDVEEDIPEPIYTNTREIEEEEETEDDIEGSSEPLGGDNLQDMTPAQKRKSAEKTAEAIMQMYCKFAPLPFENWASFSDKKITKMILDGRIDPNMQLENNVTVQEYIDATNKQVKDVFTVSEETKEEIKDPLIDVLMEQELALTPTQRLLMAVGSHVVTMGFSAFQLAQNNKQALETFEKFHQNMKQEREPSRPSQPSQPMHDNFTPHDMEQVDDIIEKINADDDGILDAEHDPTIHVEETHDD